MLTSLSGWSVVGKTSRIPLQTVIIAGDEISTHSLNRPHEQFTGQEKYSGHVKVALRWDAAVSRTTSSHSFLHHVTLTCYTGMLHRVTPCYKQAKQGSQNRSKKAFYTVECSG